MPEIEHAGHWIEVTPYVEEAVARLGFFHADAVPYLATGIAKFINHGKISYEMRRADEELTDEEKTTNGLSKHTRMARKYWDALTEEGRVEPINAPDVVLSRAISNLYREGKRRQTDESYAKSRTAFPAFWNEILLTTVKGKCCGAAELIAGKPIATMDRPTLPLPECDRDVCQCRYDVSGAYKLRRKQREKERHTAKQESGLIRLFIRAFKRL